ncbi:MAG: putative hydrolase of the HAD superfamily [Caulobacteraceae bacterium]|nr:MAG: putative hydrolase of the HAD superfamily [Caulobacteraceae bacterium]
MSVAGPRDLAERDVWVFDLDNTLYPAEHEVFDEIGARMTTFIARLTGFEHEAARVLREKYFLAYGATVVGVVKHHGASAADFLSYVHDVSFDAVHADPELAGLIERLPGRRIVFTNGARDYAGRILAKLGVTQAFDEVFALEDADLVPKPQRGAFERLVARCAFDPARAVMFEDHDRNLETAAAMGFATVLVGPPAPPAPFIHFATSSLHAFLRGLVEPSIDRSAGIA